MKHTVRISLVLVIFLFSLAWGFAAARQESGTEKDGPAVGVQTTRPAVPDGSRTLRYSAAPFSIRSTATPPSLCSISSIGFSSP